MAPNHVTLPGHYWHLDPATGSECLVEVRRAVTGEFQVGFPTECGLTKWQSLASCKGTFRGPVVKPLQQ